MKNYEQLKAAVKAVIKQNGNQEITGLVLQDTLLSIISNIGDGYKFMGTAEKGTTPGTPDGNVFYLANPGVYPNFDAATVKEGEMGVFLWNEKVWTIKKLIVGSGSGEGGKFYGFFELSSDLPGDAVLDGYAFVGSDNRNLSIYNFINGKWKDSGKKYNLYANVIQPNNEDISFDEKNRLQFANSKGLFYLRTDISLKEQIENKSNQKFIIRDNFEIGSIPINIGANNTFTFLSGKFSNGVIKGENIKVENKTNGVIFENAYFANKVEILGKEYMNRCVVGRCYDYWFEMSNSVEMLRAMSAWDEATITKDIHVTLSNKDDSVCYISKNFKVSSFWGNTIYSDNGKTRVFRFDFDKKEDDFVVDFDKVNIVDSTRDNSKENGYFIAVIGDNAKSHKITLNINKCFLLGGFGLIGVNRYGDGQFVINTYDSILDSKSFCIEAYCGTGDYKKVDINAFNTRFLATDGYSLSLVNILTKTYFSNCEISSVEIYHKGVANFIDCQLYKNISHSGPKMEGDVNIKGGSMSLKANENTVLTNAGLLFTFKGMRYINVENTSLYIDEETKKILESTTQKVVVYLMCFYNVTKATFKKCNMSAYVEKYNNSPYIYEKPFLISKTQTVKFVDTSIKSNYPQIGYNPQKEVIYEDCEIFGVGYEKLMARLDIDNSLKDCISYNNEVYKDTFVLRNMKALETGDLSAFDVDFDIHIQNRKLALDNSKREQTTVVVVDSQSNEFGLFMGYGSGLSVIRFNQNKPNAFATPCYGIEHFVQSLDKNDIHIKVRYMQGIALLFTDGIPMIQETPKVNKNATLKIDTGIKAKIKNDASISGYTLSNVTISKI